MTIAPKGISWKRNFPLQTGHWAFDLLLIAVPIAVVMRYAFALSPLWIFAASAAAIIPLAAALGKATEDLAEHVGERAGGLLNATFGNATELIIAVFALSAGHEEVVKASISGSIIGNSLLVLGASALVGGIGREKQTFSRHTVQVNATMLLMCVIALLVPAVFDLSLYGELRAHTDAVEKLSLFTSIILVITYALSVIFLFRGGSPEEVSVPKSDDHPERSKLSAGISLAITTVLIAWMSDILVAQIEAAKQALGWTDVFLGVIVIAIVGNAAEHSTALLMARRDKMDIAVSIAAGSSAQIALFVAPVLVFISWIIGHPMSFVFGPLEIVSIAISVAVVQTVLSDGETTWFEGAAMVAVYLILAVAFYFLP
jgi:Ca2+:H+ antiporter